MFTKIANIVLWLVAIVGFISSIVLGVSIGKAIGGGIGVLVVILGWVVTLLALTGFGLIVEMANNINRSRKLLEVLCDKKSLLDEKGQNETNEKDDSKIAIQNLMEKKDVWLCPRCKTENSMNAVFCERCNEPKPKSAEHWECPKCGEINNTIHKFCTVCHTMRKGANLSKDDGKDKNKNKTEQPQNYWFCSACGEKNENVNPYCIICGTQRKGLNSAATPSPKKDWKCSVCGEMNDEFSYTCKKCGGSKY